MSAAPLIQSNLHYTLTITAGPGRGKKFKLNPPKVRIGRELDNHIVIEDLKVSRYHFEIQWRQGKCVLADIAQKQNIQLSGVVVTEAFTELQSGDIITFGSSSLSFETSNQTDFKPSQNQIQAQNSNQNLLPFKAMPNSEYPALDAHYQMAPQNFSAQSEKEFQNSGNAFPGMASVKPAQKRSPFFYFLIIGVVGLFILMLTNKSKEVKKPDGIRSEIQIQQSIEDSQKVQDQLEERRQKMTVPKQIAQNLYSKGFRDYQKGNYLRAATSFQAALASDPTHELSLRYYSLSQRRNDEMIDSSLQMAQRYKGKAMYNRCVSDAQKVMTLLTNPRNPKYEEAAQLRKECQLLGEAGNF